MIRVGYGYDVHRLVEGRKLILGGVDIPYEKGLLGHSDADVLLHAITDALFGAAALGDNAKWFEDKPALIAALPALLQKGDTVLVKASHSRKFEEITEALLALEL